MMSTLATQLNAINVFGSIEGSRTYPYTLSPSSQVLIYVFDVESRELEKDIAYYQSCLEAILQNSPDAKIFCLIHKMDLVQEDQRDAIFKDREEDLKRLSKV